uniref:Uncharacterized protein n=1 Tax=Candidatus Kentrum eta TaxID=2126337 RepID=A0A450UB71_9GAMM|nr:MAG: hypothetical protein BECKH772A_GA0070896_1001514 [Candidatus Kentron sp. H]VFJ91009.1 MAG: hypothetical protein BECKH772B_GA0070898_1001314 [Candidatus Kentron sp. H]VFJ97324.1 MAG: hypothetical protein BECKH772C_GA0070978_1001214 [Candidatus Kentron sp. H]
MSQAGLETGAPSVEVIARDKLYEAPTGRAGLQAGFIDRPLARAAGVAGVTGIRVAGVERSEPPVRPGKKTGGSRLPVVEGHGRRSTPIAIAIVVEKARKRSNAIAMAAFLPRRDYVFYSRRPIPHFPRPRTATRANKRVAATTMAGPVGISHRREAASPPMTERAPRSAAMMAIRSGVAAR